MLHAGVILLFTVCQRQTNLRRSAGRQAQLQPLKERYRATIRWFCQGEAEGVYSRTRPRLSPPTRPAGAKKIRRQAQLTNYLTPVARSAGRQAQLQPLKERYRATIRWFCQGEAEGTKKSAVRRNIVRSYRRMYRAASSPSNQGGGEGVYSRTRPRLSPPTRPAGAKKSAVRRNSQTTSRLLRVQRNDWRNSSRSRSDIAPLSGGFVKAKPRECTHVLDRG